jgi:ABC-type ATPase involved in cell division
VISLRDIEKAYRTGYGQAWVLRRIDLDIAEGDFVTVMGPSGADVQCLLVGLVVGRAHADLAPPDRHPQLAVANLGRLSVDLDLGVLRRELGDEARIAGLDALDLSLCGAHRLLILL